MTRQKSFKRLVRSRMAKTGESYTAARAALLAAEEPKATEGPALSMSDEAIRRRSAAGEFERQLDNLIAKRYPSAAGLEPAAFRGQVEPLREAAAGLPESEPDLDEGRFPFVVVVSRDLVGPEASIARVERRGEAATTTMLDAGDFERFRPIERITLPRGSAYLVVNAGTGRDTRNVTPDDALEAIERQGRSPLTLEEGIALVTHFPEAVAKNGGFSLPGSRCGDRRVTALWISDGRAKLGWCWAGNPHTWLGSASCGQRIGA